MSFAPIRNKIKEKLQTIDSIQQVEDYPSNEFNGYPAAMVASTRNENEFNTTTENKRIYVFTVYVLQEMKVLGEKQARRIIEEVVDDIIEAFDQDQLLASVNINTVLPDNECMVMSAPILGEIYNEDEGKYVVGQLEIGVTIQFDIN